jgi:peptide/nickel transport system substrate-binding protein
MDTEPFESTWLTVNEERTPFVVLEANHHYWNKERGPRLSRVVFRNDISPEEALHLCTTTEGQVDIVTQVSPENAAKVVASPYAKLVNVNGKRILAGAFNRFKRDVNFGDRGLRLAFNLAVDREKIIREGFNGYANQVPALTPPWAFDFPKGLTPRPYDPEHAKQLFKEAGWPEGRVLQLAATKEYEKVARLIAVDIQAALKMGVEVSIIPPHEEVKWKRIFAEKKIIPSWDILLADAVAFFYEATPAYFHRAFFGSNGSLRMGPEIPQFNLLFKKMAAQIDQEKLLEVAREIDKYVYEEALGLFLCSPQDLYAVNQHVNFRPYRTTFELADTEVSPSHWSRVYNGTFC